jgi:hypothetical protein
MEPVDSYDMSIEACTKRDEQRRLWNIEDWILARAGSPEEAKIIAQYLTTVNWDQTIARQKDDQKRQANREAREVQEAINNGGGICDRCSRLFNTLLAFTHASSDAKSLERYNGKYCITCLNKIEDRVDIPHDECLRLCDNCHKPTQTKFIYTHPKVPSKWSGYCIDCFDPLLKAAYITCIGCGKHTLEYGSSKSVCLDCHEKYPDWATVQSHLGRARKAGAQATLTIKEWTLAIRHFNGKCAYCNKRKYQVLEHYKPVSLSGGTTSDNCLPACYQCNGTKGDKHPNDFVAFFPSENIARIKAYFASL